MRGRDRWREMVIYQIGNLSLLAVLSPISIIFIINIKMQELTKLDVNRLKEYSGDKTTRLPNPN